MINAKMAVFISPPIRKGGVITGWTGYSGYGMRRKQQDRQTRQNWKDEYKIDRIRNEES